jgi:isopenicillin-N N-acyltransferase-like protein
MIDNPLVSRAGCTSFGAWGAATPSGHLITGRNFDWEAAEVFSTNRIVLLCEPDKGIPFVSLAWAGMTGVVSGMNRAGLSVTINGAPSRLPDQTATPVAIVARDVLEHAHNLAETLEIVRRSRVFVSTLWLVGSRADARFIVIEKTPETTQVREPDGDTIVCANHFETAALKDGTRNKEYQAEATSVSRKSRFSELLKQQHGSIDPTNAAAILRDRCLPGGKFPGDGHRATPNALIATHGTVMDLTDGIFWAASPPNQLGKFVAFDVNDFSRELPDRAIAADPILTDGEYDRALGARKALSIGENQLKTGDATGALNSATKAESLNPGFYQNASLRGRALLALKRPGEAADAFRSAIADNPAFLKEKQQLEALLRQAAGRN